MSKSLMGGSEVLQSVKPTFLPQTAVVAAYLGLSLDSMAAVGQRAKVLVMVDC